MHMHLRQSIKKASVEGDAPQVAMDLREGASVYAVIWTKTGPSCQRFGVLFVESMKLGCWAQNLLQGMD